MKNSVFIFGLLVTTALGAANAYAESFKYVMGTEFVEWPESSTPSLTDNGDGTYSWQNGSSTITGAIHNGVFFVTRSDNGTSIGASSGRLYEYYTSYEYDPITWTPRKAIDSTPGYIAHEYTYQVDGNTITRTDPGNDYGYTGTQVWTYADDYNPFKHNSMLYSYNETDYGYDTIIEKSFYPQDNVHVDLSISHNGMQQFRYGNDVIDCNIMYRSDGQPYMRDYRSGDYWGMEIYNYDEETGKLLNLTNEETGEIIESYSVNADGTITVYSGDKDNGGTLVGTFNSIEEYNLSSLGENLNFTDILDSDFGKKGYIPSRLQQKNSDGSTTIYNEDGTIRGYKNKRIYTIDEANRVAGPINRVSITYR